MDTELWYDGPEGVIHAGPDDMAIAKLVCWTELLYLSGSTKEASAQTDWFGRVLEQSTAMLRLLSVIQEKYELDEDAEIKRILSYIQEGESNVV